MNYKYPTKCTTSEATGCIAFVACYTSPNANEHLGSTKCMEFDQLMKSVTSIFQLNAQYII